MSDITNDNNVTVIAITDSLECPICLSNITDIDPFYIMTCCKNKFHLQCLIQWYSRHLNQNTCFMCNQNNNFSEKFVSISNELNDFSDNTTDTENLNNLSTQMLINRTSLPSNEWNCTLLFLFILLFFCIFLATYYTYS
jgi:hypothetical protein